MKICHFIASNGYGGAEKVTIDLCNEMSKNNEVYLITFLKDKDLVNLIDNVHSYTIEKFSRYSIIGHYKLYKLLKHINPDVIHTHAVKATELIYHLRWFLPCHFIGTKHNDRKGKIFNKINFVTAVSSNVATTINNKNISIIYNGIEQIPIKQSKYAVDKNLKLITIGRLDKIKGFDILIDAINKTKLPINLDIIGHGPEYENIKLKINKLGLNKQIRLVGFINNNELPQMIQNYDALIVSSHREGFGLTILEGLFYAKVVISTPVGISEEILDKLFIMSLDNMANKLEDVYKNYMKYIYKFNYQKEKMELFNIEYICKQYIKLYKRLVL